MIPSQRHRFAIPREVAYLNCAYMSPLMTEVVEAGTPGRRAQGAALGDPPGRLLLGPEALRPLFARLIGADADGVALVPAASYGLATAAANLPLAPGRRVLVVEDQFPSNVYCWRARAPRRPAPTVATVGPGPDGDLTAALLAAIDERTAVVACAHCRWTDGALLDLAAVGAAARAVGAALVLDLTQSAGALPFDAARCGPTSSSPPATSGCSAPTPPAFSGSPPSTAAAVRSRRAGWAAAAPRTSPASSTTSPATAPAAGASTWARHRTSRFCRWSRRRSAASSTGACREIQATLAARTAEIAARAERLGLVAGDPRRRAGHFLGLGFPGPVPSDLPDRLAAAGVFVSLRGASLRVTPHLWNDDGRRRPADRGARERGLNSAPHPD